MTQNEDKAGISSIFEDIYSTNAWGGLESSSGPGSEGAQVKIIQTEIPNLLQKINALSMLDLPCGDFHWMKHVDLEGINYIGGDIVTELVEMNKKEHGREKRTFEKLNILTDSLPKVDVVLCRDCLVHFSNADIYVALKNIVRSGAKYLLTTSFAQRDGNKNIQTGLSSTGRIQWRPLTLQKAPFDFPEPLVVVNEGCTEGNGNYSDKCLMLWRTDALAPLLDPV